jgi:hypothetical protein
MTEPAKAVFLSYASQDAEAARPMRDALRAAGIELAALALTKWEGNPRDLVCRSATAQDRKKAERVRKSTACGEARSNGTRRVRELRRSRQVDCSVRRSGTGA